MATDMALAVLHLQGMANFLKQWRDSRRLTLEQVGAGIGTDKTQVSKLEKGDRKLSTDWLDRFARFYKVQPAALLSPPPAEESPAVAQAIELEQIVAAPTAILGSGSWPRDIPIWGVTVGGNGGDFHMNTGDIVDYAKRPPTMSRVGKLFALYVQGSSMARWREQGSLVYLDPVRPARPGERVVVECLPDRDGDGHPAYLKELVGKTSSKLRLKQYNPEGIIEIPLSKVRHIHRVIEWEELLGV